MGKTKYSALLSDKAQAKLIQPTNTTQYNTVAAPVKQIAESAKLPEKKVDARYSDSKDYDKIAKERFNKIELARQYKEQPKDNRKAVATVGNIPIKYPQGGAVTPVGETAIQYAPGTGDILDALSIGKDAMNGSLMTAGIGAAAWFLPDMIGKPFKKWAMKSSNPIVRKLIGAGNAELPEKRGGYTFEELNTPGITKKDLSTSRATDIELGPQINSGRIEYDNGLALRKLRREADGDDHAFIMHNPATDEHIAYIRTTQDKGASELFDKDYNEFHIKADMPNAGRENVQFSYNELSKVLPPYHGLTETTSMSADGIRQWRHQLKHGYVDQGKDNTFTVPLSLTRQDDPLLRGFDLSGNEGNFNKLKLNPDDDIILMNRVNSLIEQLNIPNASARVSKSGGIDLTLPKLRRTFGIAAPVSAAAYAGYKYDKNSKQKH